MRKDVIMEYQSRLRKIAQIEGVLPLIAVDGIFGAETEAATRAFQNYHALPVTGIADSATWQAVATAYKRALYEVTPGLGISPFPYPDYVTKAGEKSDFILIVQLLLSAVSVIYDDFEALEKTGVYDAETAEAVKRFQGFNRLPQTGAVNKSTWDRLAKNYNTFAGNGDYLS